MRCVVDVAVQDERRDLRGLSLVDDDLVEVHLIGEQAAGVADHRELRRRHAGRVDLVGTHRVRLVGTEVVHLLDERLAGIGRVRAATGVEVLGLLRERAEDGIRLDAVAQDEALAEARWLHVVEADGEVVDRIDLVDEVPDAIARKAADPVRRYDVLRGEGLAIVPFDPRPELYVVVVAVLRRRLPGPEVVLSARPVVDGERRDEEVGVDAAAEDRVGRVEVPVALRLEHVRPAAVELAALRGCGAATGRRCRRRRAARAGRACRRDESEAGESRVTEQAPPCR